MEIAFDLFVETDKVEGLLDPMVRSYRRCRNALPDVMTEVANESFPISDLSCLSVSLFV